MSDSTRSFWLGFGIVVGLWAAGFAIGFAAVAAGPARAGAVVAVVAVGAWLAHRRQARTPSRLSPDAVDVLARRGGR